MPSMGPGPSGGDEDAKRRVSKPSSNLLRLPGHMFAVGRAVGCVHYILRIGRER